MPANPASRPQCSVVLATKNRKDELRRALESAMMQTVTPEIVVFDDGSTDGTSEMVRGEFPGVKLGRSERSVGSVVNRNRAVREATGRIIISIDDDAAFQSPRTVEQTLAEFDNPRVGAVAIPYIDVHIRPEVQQAAPAGSDGVMVVNYFRGCAAAWRRDLFLELGGYAPVLYHMAEEPELCLRILNAGYVTRLGRADPVHHFESPRRDPARILAQLARNGVLQGWLNAPLVFLPVHMVKTTVRSVFNGVVKGNFGPWMKGVGKGWGAVLSGKAKRRPASIRGYLLYHWISRHGPVKLEKILDRLPAPIALEPAPGAGALDGQAPREEACC